MLLIAAETLLKCSIVDLLVVEIKAMLKLVDVVDHTLCPMR